MAYPQVIATAPAVKAAYGHAASMGTTVASSLSPKAGDSIYAFVAYDSGSGGGFTVISVTDTSSNTYKRAGILQNSGHGLAANPSVEIWYADNVPASSNLQVTVHFSFNTVLIFYVCDIRGAPSINSLDIVTSGQKGNASSSSDPFATPSPNDLSFACQCSTANTGSSLGSSGGFGFTAVEDQSGTNTTNDVQIDLFQKGPAGPSDFNASLSWTTAVNYSVLSIGLRSPVLWPGVAGRPYITVSPLGLINGLSGLSNDGADFGPDTPSTTTCGIQEALNAAAPLGLDVRLIARGVFNITGQLVLPSNTRLLSDMFGGEAYAVAKTPSPSKIHYTGSSSYAILVGNDSDTSGSVLEGLTVDGSAANALIRVQGARDVRISSCYVDNASTASTAYAIECDGGNHNTEHCLVEKCQFFANSAGGAIGIGIHDGNQHCNDWQWNFITAENSGTGPVVDGLFGGNHSFTDFYSRGGGSPVFNARGGSFKIRAGELAGTATFQLKVTAGSSKVVVEDVSWTSGGVNLTAGTVDFRGVIINTGGCNANTWTLNGSGGGLRVSFEATCDFRNAATGSGTSAGIQFQGGELYLYGPTDLFARNCLNQSGGTLVDTNDLETDNRSVTLADPSPLNLLTTAPGANSAYRVGMVLELTAYNGTTGTVQYTFAWTDWDGQSRALVVSASTLHGTANASQLVLVKVGTNPTVQVTATGTWTSTTATVVTLAQKAL